MNIMRTSEEDWSFTTCFCKTEEFILLIKSQLLSSLAHGLKM